MATDSLSGAAEATLELGGGFSDLSPSVQQALTETIDCTGKTTISWSKENPIRNFSLSSEAYTELYYTIFGTAMDTFTQFARESDKQKKVELGFLSYILATGLATMQKNQSISKDETGNLQEMRTNLIDWMHNENIINKGVTVMKNHKITHDVLRTAAQKFVAEKSYGHALHIAYAGIMLDESSANTWEKIASYADGMLIEKGYTQYMHPHLDDDGNIDKDIFQHRRDLSDLVIDDEIVQAMYDKLTVLVQTV